MKWKVTEGGAEDRTTKGWNTRRLTPDCKSPGMYMCSLMTTEDWYSIDAKKNYLLNKKYGKGNIIELFVEGLRKRKVSG